MLCATPSKVADKTLLLHRLVCLAIHPSTWKVTLFLLPGYHPIYFQILAEQEVCFSFLQRRKAFGELMIWFWAQLKVLGWMIQGLLSFSPGYYTSYLHDRTSSGVALLQRSCFRLGPSTLLQSGYTTLPPAPNEVHLISARIDFKKNYTVFLGLWSKHENSHKFWPASVDVGFFSVCT